MTTWHLNNPFLDTDQVYMADYKPLPLPEDNFGFDPTIDPAATIASATTTSANRPGPSVPEHDDFDSILFDLGISEGFEQQPRQNEPHTYERKHSRKLSGSGIFGFVGTGPETQLAIPGLPVTTVDIQNKKPVYQVVDRFDNINFTKQHQPIPQDEYFVTASHPAAYKFPPSRPPTPPAPVTASYSAQKLMNLRGISDETQYPEDLYQILQEDSKPKPVNANPFVEPRDANTATATTSSSLMSSAPLSASSSSSSSYASLTPSKPRTAPSSFTPSNFNTPFKVKNTFMDFKTPTPQKTPPQVSWTPTLVAKKNSLSEKIIQEQRRSPTKKKRPTITSTLETGTLDQYFVGPDENDLFRCTYNDCKKLFTRVSNIRAHIQTHLSDRPFSCNVCHKSFVRNHDLRRHCKGHQEFTHVCPCGKKFPRQDALKRHRIRNICVGGLPDDRGISKKKSKPQSVSTAENPTNGSKPKKVKEEVETKLVQQLDENQSQKQPFQSFIKDEFYYDNALDLAEFSFSVEDSATGFPSTKF